MAPREMAHRLTLRLGSDLLTPRLSHSLPLCPPAAAAHWGRHPSVPYGARLINFWQPVNKAPENVTSASTGLTLYQKPKSQGSAVTRLWQSVKQLAQIDEGDPDEQMADYFQYSVERLMLHPGEFTFGKFAMYLEDICTRLRLIGRRPISDDDLSVPLRQLRLQHEMMKFLTPLERESDSATVFSHQSKQLLAEMARCTVKDVNDMLHHHDICKTDRTWYFRRLVLGRHLPTTFEEREHLSYQRPIAREAAQLFPESGSLEAAKVKEMREAIHYRKPPTRTWPWFRRPTSGNNKWSSREYTKRRLH